MPRLLTVLLPLAAPAVLAAQAPDAVSLWDVAATTLARPAALELGATGAFWNPAATLEGSGLQIGIQTVDTPEPLGLSAVIAAVTEAIGSQVGVGLVFGRVQVSDLVRTSTSPISDGGDIPVYEQLVGLAMGAEFGPMRTAAILRAHDARFDLIHASGLTADIGTSIQATPHLRLAASSQFVPANLANRRTERYHAGLEYQLSPFAAWGTPAQVALRYGGQLRERRDLEHFFGLGLTLGQRVSLDTGLHYERAFGNDALRFVFAIGVRSGRYAVVAARGGGLEGVGANYRVGLDVNLSR